MHIGDIALILAITGPLTGIIYANLRGSIKRNKEEIDACRCESEKWREEDHRFKLKVTESLTRLETLVINGKKV